MALLHIHGLKLPTLGHTLIGNEMIIQIKALIKQLAKNNGIKIILYIDFRYRTVLFKYMFIIKWAEQLYGYKERTVEFVYLSTHTH